MSETQAIETLLRKIAPGRETAFDVVDDLDGTKSLKITLAELPKPLPLKPEAPDIARAKARAHTFHESGRLLNILQREGNPQKTVVLADANARAITAVLDEADKLDREQVSFAATYHPFIRPWLDSLNKTMTIQTFALFLMQHRSRIVEPDGRELAIVCSQVTASKSITIARGTGKAFN